MSFFFVKKYNRLGGSMRLSDLQSKDIVALEDGKKIGNIIDVSIDDKGNMVALIVQKSKFLSNIFSSQSEIEIKWNQVKKIGEDVILVNMNIS